MKLIGLLAARNEAHDIGLTARAALKWCDELVILMHSCTDATGDIAFDISEEGGAVVPLVVSDPTWNEMRHRQMMLEAAQRRGATHIAIVDCDEIITGNLLSRIRGMVERTSGDRMLTLPLYNLRGSLTRYHADGIWGNRIAALAFRDNPNLRWGGDTFHHRDPHGATWKHVSEIAQGDGGIMHLWAVSEERLRDKHRLYRLTERLRWPDKPVAEIDRMYGWACKGDPSNPRWGTPDTWTYKETPSEWWEPYRDLIRYYNPTLVPWQKAECERIIIEHGIEKFKGLDLS